MPINPEVHRAFGAYFRSMKRPLEAHEHYQAGIAIKQDIIRRTIINHLNVYDKIYHPFPYDTFFAVKCFIHRGFIFFN